MKAAIILMAVGCLVATPVLLLAHDGVPSHDAWYANQYNMMGGHCCKIGDNHQLDPGDVRFNPVTGNYSVRLPDPHVKTFGHSLNEPSTLPKQWVEIVPNKLRDPKGGMPPRDMNDPIIWYDIAGSGMMSQNDVGYYSIYCFEPNPQF